MQSATKLPQDAGTPHRKLVDQWDDLWKGDYPNTGSDAASAPSYTRGWGRTIAGLFQRQPPTLSNEQETPAWLPDLLEETVHRSSGYGCVVLRPVSNGETWKQSVVPPTRFVIDWAEREPVSITVWDTTIDPRYPDDQTVGLALLEQWTPDETGPGFVATQVWTTKTVAGGTELADMINLDNPPTMLADHPYVISAQNDSIARQMVPFVWAWEDCGPVPLWYGVESTILGLARLWDQEQDDAEMTRKRVAMPVDVIGKQTVRADGGEILARPGLTQRDNILALESPMVAEYGPNGGVTPIEFGDDLVQRERIERRENAVLEMVNINPSSIGRNVSGRSDSGTAKRADNQMTLNTISAPARSVAAALTVAMSETFRLNREPLPAGTTVVVSEGLKPDPLESAETARALRDADAASTRTLVATAQPTWSADQIDAEVAAMESEGLATAPFEV